MSPIVRVKGEKNLYRDTRSGIYSVRKFRKDHTPLWKSTRTDSITLARRVRDDLISKWLGEDSARTLKTSFKNLFKEAQAIKDTKSEKTALSAEHAIRHLEPWFNEHRPFANGFNESWWEEYIQAQRALTPGRKLKHDREILIFTLNLARKKGLVTKIFSLRKPDPKTEIGKLYSDDEIERLLAHASNDLRFQILIAVKMGMRKREILHLAWDRIDIEKGIIALQPEHTKTRRKRYVPIHSDLLSEFRRRKKKAKSLFVFPSPAGINRPVNENSSAWEACKEEAKVTGRFHDLRHKAITEMLAGGISQFDVEKITGVSPEVIRRVYHHLRPEVMTQVSKLNCGKFVKKEKKQ